jgi:tetratricopeptide (TPR) repeat protein
VGNERYTFRHALIHDQAYECLLKSQRVSLHAGVVEVIESRFPQLIEQDTVVVARHCELAGLAEKAVTHWSSAASRALSRSANREAVHHIRRALAVLTAIDDEAKRNRYELDLQIELGAAYQAVRGFASSKAVRCFERARELCELGDAPAKLIDIQRGLLTGYYVRGQHRVSQKMAEEMLGLGKRNDDPSISKVGHYLLGASLFWQGRFPEARDEFTEALTDHDAVVQRYEQLSFQIDPVVSLEFHQAWVLWMLGYPEQAWTGISRAVELAERRRQPLTLAMALFVLSAIHACCYNGRAHGPRLEQLLALCAEHDLAHPAACAKFLSGQDLVARGRAEDGLAMIHEGVAAFDEQEAGLGKPWGLAAAALAYLRLGEPDKGLAIVADTLELVEKHGEYQWHAELHRIEGMLLLAQSDDDGAISSFRRAMEIANKQSAKSLELRARVSLARLRQARGELADAESELLSTYSWFSEGFLNDDLKEAATLLSQLSSA